MGASSPAHQADDQELDGDGVEEQETPDRLAPAVDGERDHDEHEDEADHAEHDQGQVERARTPDTPVGHRPSMPEVCRSKTPGSRGGGEEGT